MTATTLTAEQVRELMEYNSHDYPSPTDPYVFITEYDWQAIADELNAVLGRGECSIESMHGYTDAFAQTRYSVQLSCHTIDDWGDSEPPDYCPYCGKKVVS